MHDVGDVFLSFWFISTRISCFPFSPGSGEAHIGWGGNLDGRLMALLCREYSYRKLLKSDNPSSSFNQ